MAVSPSTKPVIWIGSAKADLLSFPEEVKDSIGFALYAAQQGGKHLDAKPLRGFGGAGVLEVVVDHDGDTYRAVYTVRLAGRVCATRVPEKVEVRDRNAESGNQLNQSAAQASRGITCGVVRPMKGN